MDLKKTGRLIARKRKAMGLSQGKLSEKLGVTPQDRGIQTPHPR